MAQRLQGGMIGLAMVVAMTGGLPTAAAATGLMTACSAEITANCKGVAEGRGRISACLFAHSNRLAPPCKAEVTKVSNSWAFKRAFPHPETLQGSEYEAELKKTCGPDLKRLCPGVASGGGRLLACLYAQGDHVSKACRAEEKSVIDHLR